MPEHVTHRGVTADIPNPIPWVLTLHPDGTASGFLPTWHGTSSSTLTMTHAAARLLIARLPHAKALEGEVEALAASARLAHPMPRVVSAAVARIKARLAGRAHA